MMLKGLRKLREENGLTQAELAEKLYITPQSVSRWENGESEPDLDTLCRLSDIFKVSVDTLLSRDSLPCEELFKHIAEYIRKSDSFSDAAMKIQRRIINARLNGNFDTDTYSVIRYKNSIFTYSDREDTPRLSFLYEKNGGECVELKEKCAEYEAYLSALSSKNVILALPKLAELEAGVCYDKISLCSKLKITEDVFDNISDKLMLCGLLGRSEIGVNKVDITVYEAKDPLKALSVYALVRQLFMCGSDGQAFEI